LSSQKLTFFSQGNQADFNLARFNRLVGIANKHGGQFGNDAFAEERVLVYNEARDTNPTFNAGIRWLAVTTAERVFIFRALPNGTDPTNANIENVGPFYLNETFPGKLTFPTDFLFNFIEAQKLCNT